MTELKQSLYDRGHYPKTDCSYDPRPFCPADGYDWPCPTANLELGETLVRNSTPSGVESVIEESKKVSNVALAKLIRKLADNAWEMDHKDVSAQLHDLARSLGG